MSPYMVLHTVFTVWEDAGVPLLPETYLPLLHARGFCLRSPTAVAGTLEMWDDPATGDRHFRQTIPRACEEPTP